MAHYIAYATEAGTREPQEVLNEVHAMLDLGIWGVPTTAQLRSKLLPGDGLIVAVGVPYRQFVGDAVLGSRFRKFADDELADRPAGLDFDHGVTLARARVWRSARLIDELWSRTAAAERNPLAQFFGAINPISSVDAAVIVAAGADENDGYNTTRHAEAEDDKVIALMNARRAGSGKPPLSADQEKQVRENRRSQ